MCLICETPLSKETSAQAFGERYLEILNSASLALMISIGHRTGLFETLRQNAPCTSDELASEAGLNERYVREWLGAMTTGKIVECDDTGSVFTLADGPAVLLTDLNQQNVAHLAQFISILGGVEDGIVNCFHQGGGLPYSAYPRFHEVMAQESAQTVSAALQSHILPLIPELISSLENGISVLDVGCGQGRALLKLAGLYPNSQFTGYDLCREPLEFARAEARKRGLNNVRFEQRDLSTFHQDAPFAQFDWITAFDAVHDQARPDYLLAGIFRALRDDGLFLMQDIGAASNVADNRNHTIAPLLYTISCMHCMSVSLGQGGLGVGAVWGEQLANQFLTQAGFKRVNRHTLEHDIQNYYYVVRK